MAKKKIETPESNITIDTPETSEIRIKMKRTVITDERVLEEGKTYSVTERELELIKLFKAGV